MGSVGRRMTMPEKAMARGYGTPITDEGEKAVRKQAKKEGKDPDREVRKWKEELLKAAFGDWMNKLKERNRERVRAYRERHAEDYRSSRRVAFALMGLRRERGASFIKKGDTLVPYKEPEMKKVVATLIQFLTREEAEDLISKLRVAFEEGKPKGTRTAKPKRTKGKGA